MRRAPPPLVKERRIQVFHAALAQAASMAFSIFLELSLPTGFLICERMPGAVQFLAGIRESFPRARLDPAGVYRDCCATSGPANSAALWEIGGAVGGAFFAEAQRL